MRTNFWILLALTALLTLGLLACSSDEGMPGLAESESGATTRTTTMEEASLQPSMVSEPPISDTGVMSPRSGGHLTLAALVEYPHRDIHQSDQETLTTLGPGLSYSRLLRLDTGPEVDQPNLKLECDLCASWEMQPDGSYLFRLRDDIVWQNIYPVNGRPLVAEDLEFSYRRLRTPGWPAESRFADRGIGEIEAVDDRTLRVHLKFRDSDALLAIADGQSKIVAPEVVEEYGDLRRAPVIGTGPWVHEQRHAGGLTNYTRNPDYFEPDLPYLDGINVQVVSAPGDAMSVNARRLALLQAGQIDVLVTPPTDWQELDRSSVEFNSRVSQQPEIGMVMSLNTQQQPLDNLAIRQAIFRAIDPWEYVDLNWWGQGGVGMGMPVRGDQWQLAQSELLAGYLGSPSLARDILQENEIFYPPTLELAVADLGPNYRQVADRIAEDLAAVGFKVNMTPMDPATLHRSIYGEERNYQIALAPAPPHPTPNGYLYAILHSDGPGNIANHEDPVLDALIEGQAAELDPERRRRTMLAMQRRAMEQAYLFSPITGSYRWVFNWDLENFYPNTALSEYHYWSEAWLNHRG